MKLKNIQFTDQHFALRTYMNLLQNLVFQII